MQREEGLWQSREPSRGERPSEARSRSKGCDAMRDDQRPPPVLARAQRALPPPPAEGEACAVEEEADPPRPARIRARISAAARSSEVCRRASMERAAAAARAEICNLSATLASQRRNARVISHAVPNANVCQAAAWWAVHARRQRRRQRRVSATPCSRSALEAIMASRSTDGMGGCG